MSNRNKKKRALEKAGIVHAAGWIRAKDKQAFDELVKKAALKVKRVSDDA